MTGEIKSQEGQDHHDLEDYSHVYRRKTRTELIRISAAVMGIEFSYAAETAFVSPTLLQIGVEHQHMTLVWALSPLVGFFLTPVLGSLSDRCNLRIGRRRAFIVAMSVGVLLGLILVPQGEKLGYILGDPEPAVENLTQKFLYRTTAFIDMKNNKAINETINQTFPLSVINNTYSVRDFDFNRNVTLNELSLLSQNTSHEITSNNNSHPLGVFFTVLGTVLLDFDADACQSPARAYLLDVTIPEDHARGLSTFTIMAGLGGFFGYALGGINWDVTFLGELLGGHVRAVFTLVSIIFVICIAYTVTSFKEIPLYILETVQNVNNKCESHDNIGYEQGEDENIGSAVERTYGSMDISNQVEENVSSTNTTENARRKSIAPNPKASFKIYLQSIIFMPHSIRMLCLVNLFCWMAHVCYSLYFTDFVGEAVFKGNPAAPEDSLLRTHYDSGVRFGCWGMSMYSLSCACYSTVIERFISKFGAKKVYIGGLLTYSIGMFLMALTRSKVGVILFSWTAGVLYSTLFTMPYLLVAHYHSKGIFEVDQKGEGKVSGQIRGLGTDVAIVSSMVFLAQFILSMCMGTIVRLSGTTTAVVSVASTLAFCGALSATQVIYLDI